MLKYIGDNDPELRDELIYTTFFNWIEEKGWIDAVGHVADEIHALINCEGITEDTCKEIMDTIKNKLFEGKDNFNPDEDERLTTIIYYDII